MRYNETSQYDTLRVISLVDFDRQFERARTEAGINPNVLNQYDLTDPRYTELLQAQIFSDGSGADFIARCQCGETEGNNKIGMSCPICHSRVERASLLDDDHLLFRNWLEAPQDLKHGWLTPKIYLNLAHWLSYGKDKKNYLDDILDVDTPIPFELQDVVKGKGFTYLAENFDRLMSYFMYDHPIISKKPDTTSIRMCIQMYRDRIFCHYIPILNSAISPILTTDTSGRGRRRYSDVTSDHVLQACISLSSLAFSPPKRKNRQLVVERTAYKAFKDIVAYVEEATKKYISKKKAIPRTHIFGSRFHWSFRSVITPITEYHWYYELHVPWKMAVNTLRVHLHGLLTSKHGHTMNEAFTRVRNALQKVDPLIKEIIDTMIAESPFPGLPCLWDRPPSIRDGSVMLKYWTKIKTDLNDSSVSITAIDVALPNASQ